MERCAPFPLTLVPPTENVAGGDDHLSIFDQPWWRNVVARSKGYHEKIVSKGDIPLARISYSIRRERWVGIPWGSFSPLSYLNGPVFSAALDPAEKADALRTLIRRILRSHPLTSFIFTCDPQAEDAEVVRQEFFNAGFKRSAPPVSVRYPDQPCLMSGTSDDQAINKRRSHIRNARKKLAIIETVGPDEFIAFYNLNLQARGITPEGNYLDDAIARPLMTEGILRGRVRILAARRKKASPEEPEPPLDAAIVIASDKAFTLPFPDGIQPPHAPRCYLLLLTYRQPSTDRSSDKPNPDANKVLILEAADLAAKHGMIFDTGGAATPGADTFYRQLFPDPRSREHRELFERVKWHAAWHERFKLACKQVAARFGIRQIRLSKHNLQIVLGKLLGREAKAGSEGRSFKEPK